MKKKLVIVESPAKARTLSRILGSSYSLKASVGHVRDLPKSRLGVDVENGFVPTYVVPRVKSKVARELKEAAKTASAVYLATDPDTFNPVITDFYRQVGYLPEAIINYLALLGWSLDDRTEHFSREQLIESFSLDRVNKAPASFDPKKLVAFQERHMRQLPIDRKAAMALPYLERTGMVASPPPEEVKAKIAEILTAAADRIKVAGDVLDYADFFLPDDRLPYDEKAFDKWIRKAEVAELLERFRDELAAADPFDVPALETLMQDFIASERIKIGHIIHAVRVAVTGKPVGFGLFETLAILGKDRCLARIDLALGRL